MVLLQPTPAQLLRLQLSHLNLLILKPNQSLHLPKR
uniref:Coatomer subunit delta n=1 Tax=Triatoma infestans TaxID=30076 RepID=A0A171APT3_TRIIF